MVLSPGAFNRPPVLSAAGLGLSPPSTPPPDEGRPRTRAISEGSGEDAESAAASAAASVGRNSNNSGGSRRHGGAIVGVGGYRGSGGDGSNVSVGLAAAAATAAAAIPLSPRSMAPAPIAFELEAMLAALTANVKARSAATSALRETVAVFNSRLYSKLPQNNDIVLCSYTKTGESPRFLHIFKLTWSVTYITYTALHTKARAVKTRISALRWIMALHLKIPMQLAMFGTVLVDVLLQTLKDKEDRVLVLGLEALSEISSCSQEVTPSPKRHAQVDAIYLRFITGLVNLLKPKEALFGERGDFAVQQLASLIPPYRLYVQLARAIAEEENVACARGVVRKLNWILLTAPELNGLREDLRSMETAASRELFAIVYKSWCPSPIATLSFCLLAQMYEHATALLLAFTDIDFTAVHVEELEKLAQLFDLPIFNFARLQMLTPQ